MYCWKPCETESIRAMPIMPMLPAKAVSSVRAFLVIRLLSESCRAVAIDMDLLRRLLARPLFFATAAAESGAAAGTNGSVSLITWPSDSLTMRVEYCSASSELCVTMMTRRFSDIFLRISITCELVSVSRAPVGSSARMMSGSLIRARAIATRWTCPPDISAGFLYI